MKKKAQITNVTRVNGKFRVEYESGAHRTFSKMTKTIEAWIQKQEPVYSNPFFKSADAELIFYLTQADGETRMKKLEVNRKHYTDKKAAKAWRDNLMKIIHPDESKNPFAADAAAEVNRIYEDMIAA